METFLRSVSLFHELSPDSLAELAAIAEEVRLAPGDELLAEGSMGDRAYIVRAGQVEIYKTSLGRQVLVDTRMPGEVIGELALLEQKPRQFSVRASEPATLVSIHQEPFNRLLDTSPSAARAMLHIVLQRMLRSEGMIQQSEKMAQLGTLTAGIAHELNNPAAAVQRAATQLADRVSDYARAQSALDDLPLSADESAVVAALEQRIRATIQRPPLLDPLQRSDREVALEAWLAELGVGEPWDFAPVLAAMGYTVESAAPLAAQFAPAHVPPLLVWLCNSYEVQSLLAEIGYGATQIVKIVGALRSYVYHDQAPLLAVDVHDGLDNTLLMLRHELKDGITVHRDYCLDMPRIQAYGSELNQVWTNILHNAADALAGQPDAAITIRTRYDAAQNEVVVEIEDNGPGIPADILPRIFDPFFTTKEPGKGTGMGLNISHSIVVQKHRGHLTATSRPGATCFQIRLPVASP
jgi:signal transduction histidine kinase